MFIKYGEEKHLSDLNLKGEMYFNPCKFFRNIEKEQSLKGIGDCNDGAICANAENTLISCMGKTYEKNNTNIPIIINKVLKTPIFCLSKVESEFIDLDYRTKLKNQFPDYTHALIIRDEDKFLKNICKSMRKKAFSHTVFYQDDKNHFDMEFFQFLRCEKSDIEFILPKKTNSFYMTCVFEGINNTENDVEFNIDDTNFYKTMYQKSSYFSDQKEYRIVLPYESKDNGEIFKIRPLNAELVKIDELIK